MDETSFRQKLCTACLSQAPNNIICNESSIKTKDMARERNLHLIQNRERERHRERQSLASHTRYRERFQHAIQNINTETDMRESSACKYKTQTKHRDKRYERQTDRQTERMRVQH